MPVIFIRFNADVVMGTSELTFSDFGVRTLQLLDSVSIINPRLFHHHSDTSDFISIDICLANAAHVLPRPAPVDREYFGSVVNE